MNIIENYSFGKIIIAGQRFNKDLIVFPEEIIENWWRKEGHSLCLEDLTVLNQKLIEILIVGTGATGLLKVPEEVISSLKEQGIETIVLRTSEATDRFNEALKFEKKVAGAFHLTC